MPQDPQEKQSATLEELTISNMYEIEAVVELLEEKGNNHQGRSAGQDKEDEWEGINRHKMWRNLFAYVGSIYILIAEKMR